MLLDFLSLQQREEALCHRIVVAISATTHAGFQIVIVKELAPITAGVLHALIRVRQDSFFLLAAPQCHHQCIYHRFSLSHRDIEDLLAQRGIEVSYEASRQWCNKFGPQFYQRLRRKHQGYGDMFYIDEVFVKIQGKQHYLSRAVDQDV